MEPPGSAGSPLAAPRPCSCEARLLQPLLGPTSPRELLASPGAWWGAGARSRARHRPMVGPGYSGGGGSHGRVRGLGAERRLPAEGMPGAPPPASVNPHEVLGGSDRPRSPRATGQPGVLAEVPGSESDGWGEWAESVPRPLPKDHPSLLLPTSSPRNQDTRRLLENLRLRARSPAHTSPTAALSSGGHPSGLFYLPPGKESESTDLGRRTLSRLNFENPGR